MSAPRVTLNHIIAEAVAFGARIDQGREAYTGGPKQFQHNGHTREAAYPWISDTEIAGMVRMLLRSDIGHEAIVCAARDRIMHLSQENERLRKELYASQRNVDELLKKG